MVVGFTTTCAISAYHHYHFEFDPHSIKYQLLDRFTKSLKVTELLFFNHFIYMLCFKQMVSFT
jgi:hypothetical protein